RALSGNFQLEQATLLKQLFHDLKGHFELKETAPEVLNINVAVPYFGGELSGPIRLELRSPLQYELNLTASQVNLQEFGRHNLGPRPAARAARPARHSRRNRQDHAQGRNARQDELQPRRAPVDEEADL